MDKTVKKIFVKFFGDKPEKKAGRARFMTNRS